MESIVESAHLLYLFLVSCAIICKALAPILQSCSISFSTTVGLSEVSCSRISDVSGKRNLLYKIWIELKLSVGVSLWTSCVGGFLHVLSSSRSLLKFEKALSWRMNYLTTFGLRVRVFEVRFSKILWLWWSFLPLYVCVDPRFTYLSFCKDVPESPWSICLEFESKSLLPAIAACSYWGGVWHIGSHICAGFWSKRVVLVLKLVEVPFSVFF